MRSAIQSLIFAFVVFAASQGNAASRQVDLDTWLSRDLMPYVSQQLTNENPQSASNKLALALRDRLRNSLADVPGIRIAWQPEQSTPGNVNGSIDCTKDDVHYYIGIELTEDRAGSLSVEVRALDIEDRTWVAGFSRSWHGPLSTPQRRLLRQPETDLSFRGRAPRTTSPKRTCWLHTWHIISVAHYCVRPRVNTL